MKYNQSQLSYISLDSLLFICRDCTQHALKNTVVKFLQFGSRKYYIIISKRKFILYQGLAKEYGVPQSTIPSKEREKVKTF